MNWIKSLIVGYVTGFVIGTFLVTIIALIWLLDPQSTFFEAYANTKAHVMQQYVEPNPNFFTTGLFFGIGSGLGGGATVVKRKRKN